MSEEKFYQTFYKSNIIQPLKGFCATVEAGCSMNAGGKKLGLTATAISKQIGSLEEKLKVKLFRQTPKRTNRIRLELTEEGRDFYEKAKEIVEKTDCLLCNFFEDKEDKNNKVLNITSSIYVFEKILPYANEFKNIHKNIDINLHFMQRDKSFESLSNNNVDIFISCLEDQEKIPLNLKFVELTRYKPLLVLYKDHILKNKSSNEITNKDLVNNKFVFDSEKNISMKSLKEFIQSNNIETNLDIGSCNAETIRFLIKNKMCIWIILDIFLNENDKKDFVFKYVKNFFPDGSYGCFINESYKSKKIVKDFIKFLTSKKEDIFKDKILLDGID